MNQSGRGTNQIALGLQAFRDPPTTTGRPPTTTTTPPPPRASPSLPLPSAPYSQDFLGKMRILPETYEVGLAIREEVAPFKLSNSKLQKKIEDSLECLLLKAQDVIKIGEIFKSEMEKGIRDEPSSLLMENTYIPELPDGTEEGEYLSLDLGGTNFRVLYLSLNRGDIQAEKVKQYHISDELRLGNGQDLFDHLAECVSDFVHCLGIANNQLPLGFTFSFPMHQKSLDVGLLVTWTKSFAASNVEGRDVVQMLEEAMERRGDNHVEAIAVLNDATGTLIQGAALDRRTSIGLILGTGSNACYLEKADKVVHWESERHGEKEIVIDIEWGAFGDNGVIDFIKTPYDRLVDNNSLFTNSYMFEKYIAGKYLGETVRVVLVHLSQNNLILKDGISKKLQTPNSFLTSYVSQIEYDTINNTTNKTEEVLKEFDLVYDEDDVSVVKVVCEIVSLRGAILVSVCLAELLNHMKRSDVTVAVDGSLYKKHPRFKSWMEKFVKLLAPEQKFQLMSTEDGSGKGAALAAAIALKLRKRN